MVSALFVALLAPAAAGEPNPSVEKPTAPDEIPSNVVKVLRTTNKAQINRYVPKVYAFKNVNPFSVVRFYRRVIELEEGRFATFVAPDGKSGLVLVVVPEYQIESLDKLMTSLDRPDLTTSGDDYYKYIQLRHRAADDVGFLGAVWSQGTRSSSRPPGGSRVSDVEFYCDLETNAIFVQGPQSIADSVESAARALDLPVPQVLIEATLYELDLNNDNAIGFDYYAWKNGPGRNLFAVGAYAEYEKVNELQGGVPLYNSGVNSFGLPESRFRSRGANAAYFLDIPSAYLDFLVTKGVGRIITTGRILSKIPTTYKSGLNAFGQATFDPETDRPALAAAPAEFRANDEVLYYKVETGPTPRAGARAPASVLDPYGDDPTYPDNRTVVGKAVPLRAGGTTVNQRTLAAVEVGTLLQVTPRIAEEDMSLRLRMEVSSLLGFDGTGNPRISARRVETDVRVRDGEEVVFGGIERTSRMQSTRKMPLLGSLPGIGWAFGHEMGGSKKCVVVAVIRAVRQSGGLTAEAAEVARQVGDEAPAPLPPNRFGFDQWWIDNTR
ncbi:MAG: hypothetical protein N3D11_00200 [Candidatus Sumerlaeia bacterium]|nr:hypothetical protein [Candidatus Sumerlaeia bacterium]